MASLTHALCNPLVCHVICDRDAHLQEKASHTITKMVLGDGPVHCDHSVTGIVPRLG